MKNLTQHISEKLRIGRDWKNMYDWEDTKRCYVIDFLWIPDKYASAGFFSNLRAHMRVVSDLEIERDNNDEYTLSGQSLYDRQPYVDVHVQCTADREILFTTIDHGKDNPLKFTIFIHPDDREKVTEICEYILVALSATKKIVVPSDIFKILELDKKYFPNNLKFNTDSEFVVYTSGEVIKNIKYMSTLKHEHGK